MGSSTFDIHLQLRQLNHEGLDGWTYHMWE
jgi:hypothetical protein